MEYGAAYYISEYAFYRLNYDVILMTEKHYGRESKSRPNWCPLMDLPEKDNGDYPANTFDAGFAEGWNQCIDEITGEP